MMKIGIDLGGSHIGIGVIDENGTILVKRETDLKKQDTPLEKFIIHYITETVQEFMGKYAIEVIGIASPGTPKDGKITTLVNLGIKELAITDILSKICTIPVVIHNDAKCAAMAEKQYGSLKGYTDSVFLCLGTGIGGAVFMNDVLLQPKRNPGFELGHMIIQKDGNLCNCGKRGCFETYCSMKRWKDILIDVMALPKDIPAQKLLEILAQRKQEEKIKQVIDQFLDDLIIGLSNIIDIFEPEAICLGGSFVYFEDILYKKLVQKYEEKRYVFNKQDMPILKLATLGNDAGMIGAPICLFDKIRKT